MKAVEHINSTFVRHNWKAVTDGIATGKTYVVENHGVPEAVVSAPESLHPAREDIDAYFARIMAGPPVPLAQVEVTRGAEV